MHQPPNESRQATPPPPPTHTPKSKAYTIFRCAELTTILCKTVNTDALLKRNLSVVVSYEPEELRDKLPPYVPTRIRDCAVSWMRTTLNSEICMIDLSSNT